MRRVLIANRGEIARRVIRACRGLGLETAAVYSDADAHALHVREADVAARIGPAPARESYLSIDALMIAAAKTGADAIHPGYGFLAESAELADRAASGGLTWVGPAPETIRLMGDKARARETAERAGAPVVPGSPRFEDPGDPAIAEWASCVGYPLLVKASAGGGGLGMRRVDAPEKLADTVAATHSMASKAFGDGGVFLERFIPTARHVELQVFGLGGGFGDGTALHFFERDCSLQRRFQKVIEESPAPGLRAETGAAMTQAALAICRATGYAGAGTVEFIMDAETQEFFFLEMNTRIQVEHPVTEMVTDHDLVALQLQLAAGAWPDLRQPRIERSGAAIEARLYAERPEKGFLPSPGTLTRFRPPEPTDDLRIETGYAEGDAVTPFYDPMIAKLIARGPDRDAARRRLIEALRALEVDGLGTNRAFLIACLEDTEFAAGRVDTGYIDRRRKTLLEVA